MNKDQSKFLKTLGDLKKNDQFKFVFNGEVQDKIYELIQPGKGESGCCAITGASDSHVWHHDAKVFQIKTFNK